MNSAYLAAVRLLLKVVPYVFESDVFALKGGTAINLFLKDLPRLSVDLDLVFRDHRLSRKDALIAIRQAIRKLKEQLSKSGLICEQGLNRAGDEVKLFVTEGRSRIKIEVNYVFRGTVLPVEERMLTQKAEQLFFTEVTVPILCADELYGSKLVAAMDRQHPRDFFDILELRKDGSLTNRMVECFVCYLAGHNRPIHEVLHPNPLKLESTFLNEFQGMTREIIELDRIESIRQWLFSTLPAALSVNQSKFLLSLVRTEPEWELMECVHLKELPAVQWKVKNLNALKRSNKTKFEQQAELLEILLKQEP